VAAASVPALRPAAPLPTLRPAAPVRALQAAGSLGVRAPDSPAFFASAEPAGFVGPLEPAVLLLLSIRRAGGGRFSSSSSTSIERFRSLVARRNSAIPRPSVRPSSGSFLGPKMRRAAAMMNSISCMPIGPNMGRHDTPTTCHWCVLARHRLAGTAPDSAFGGCGPEGPRTQRTAPVWRSSLHADEITPHPVDRSVPSLGLGTAVQPSRVRRGRLPGASERATLDDVALTTAQPERVKRSELRSADIP